MFFHITAAIERIRRRPSSLLVFLLLLLLQNARHSFLHVSSSRWGDHSLCGRKSVVTPSPPPPDPDRMCMLKRKKMPSGLLILSCFFLWKIGWTDKISARWLLFLRLCFCGNFLLWSARASFVGFFCGKNLPKIWTWFLFGRGFFPFQFARIIRKIKSVRPEGFLLRKGCRKTTQSAPRFVEFIKFLRAHGITLATIVCGKSVPTSAAVRRKEGKDSKKKKSYTSDETFNSCGTDKRLSVYFDLGWYMHR